MDNSHRINYTNQLSQVINNQGNLKLIKVKIRLTYLTILIKITT